MYQFNRQEYEQRMEWFQQARFGMFIHWGIYAIPARQQRADARRGLPPLLPGV